MRNPGVKYNLKPIKLCIINTKQINALRPKNKRACTYTGKLPKTAGRIFQNQAVGGVVPRRITH